MSSSKAIATTHAPTLWKYLNGQLNVFKPAGMSINLVKAALRGNICDGRSNL